MPDTNQRIIGLQKEIVATETGAEARFHVVKAYSVNHIDGSSAVSLLGYVSREMLEAGKGHVLIRTVPIVGAPMAGRIEDLPTWFAHQLIKATEGHDLVGAVPVYAEPAQPDSEEPAA